MELREPMMTLRNFNATLLHQYPIPIESQVIMRAGPYSIFRGSDIWCRSVIGSAMQAGKTGRGKAMPLIRGLSLVGQILFLVLIERMSSAEQCRPEGERISQQNFGNPWHTRDARGWVAWQQHCVGGS